MTRLATALAGVALVTALAGCVGPFVPPPRPSPSSTAAPAPSDGPACQAPSAAVAADPALIVGDWICTGSTTEMRFRFSADGRYASRESMEYNIPTGRFVFHRDQQGTYKTRGERLELTPTRSTRTRKMPESPERDYVDKPDSKKPRTFTFRADPAALHLHEAGGWELILVRVP